MAHIAGIKTEKDAKGNILRVTFDFKKHKEDVMPILQKLGAIEEDAFEKEWLEAQKTGYTVEEARKELYKRIEKRWEKRSSSLKK